MLLNKYNIDTKVNDCHPILTPFQYLYPRTNHLPREVESRNFQKAVIAVTCPSKEIIFTFYNTLQHIAGSFNILLKRLLDITKNEGV